MKLLTFIICASALAAQPAAPEKTPFGRNNITKAHPNAANSTVIVNAASYLPGISPGGLSTIFGRNLTSVSGVISASTDPLPLVLGNVSVTVNGRPAPIFSIAYSAADQQDQISFQVPYRTETGPNAAEVQVFNFGQQVADIITDSFTEDPGIFAYGAGNYAVALAASDYSLIGPKNPAIPGEVLTLYTTGLGRLTLDLRDGYGAPSNPLAYTVDAFDVVVNGEKCAILFSGLGPGFVGLYQINIRLPQDLPNGNLDVQILSSYGNSQIATLPVLY